MTQFFCRLSRIFDGSRLYEKIVKTAVAVLLSSLLLPATAQSASISFAVDATLNQAELSNTSKVIRAIAKNLAEGTTISLVVFDRAYQNGVPMAVVDADQLDKIDSVLNRVEYSETSNIATGIEKAFSDLAGQDQPQIILIGNAAITLEDTDKVAKFTQWLDVVLMPKIQASDVTLTTIDIERPNDTAIEDILNRGDFTQLLSSGEAVQTAKKIAMILPSGTVAEDQVERDINDTLDSDGDGSSTTDTSTTDTTTTDNNNSVATTQANAATDTAVSDSQSEDINTTTTPSATTETQVADETTPDTTEETLAESEPLTDDTSETGVVAVPEESASSNRLIMLAGVVFLSLLVLGAVIFMLLKRRGKQQPDETLTDKTVVRKDQDRYFSAHESVSANELFNKQTMDPEGETELHTKAKPIEDDPATESKTIHKSQPQEDFNLDDTLPRPVAVDGATSKRELPTKKPEPVDDSNTVQRDIGDSALEELRTITRSKQEGNNIE